MPSASLTETAPSPVELAGEYLAKVANTQYGILESNGEFSVHDRPITIAVEGCARSYFQLKKYSPDTKGSDPSLSPRDFETWNLEVDRRNAEVRDNLRVALEASSCAFKNGNFHSTFPEFLAFDEFWSKTYDDSGFLTNEEYEEKSQAQPALIDQSEFLKRMGCLSGFAIKPLSLSPKVCMIDRFEGLVKN